MQGQERTRYQAGITLTEVIVVTAIAAILGAIVFGALAPSRESGRRSVCASNLKQLWDAAYLYAQDNDSGVYPEIADLVYVPIYGYDPYGPLRAYGQDKSLDYCPSSTPKFRSSHVMGYAFSYFGAPNSQLGPKTVAQRNQDLLDQYGADAHQTTCLTHDALFYYPRSPIQQSLNRKSFLQFINTEGTFRRLWRVHLGVHAVAQASL